MLNIKRSWNTYDFTCPECGCENSWFMFELSDEIPKCENGCDI